MAVLPVGIGSEVGAGGYQISRSLRFNSTDSAYLNRTPASAGNRKTWTWSGWVKRGNVSSNDTRVFGAGTSNSDRALIAFENYIAVVGTNSGSNVLILFTTAVYRDPSAWYHIVVAIDTTQATSSNRAKIYVNGVQVTSFGTATYPSQNTDLEVNSTNPHVIGTRGTYSVSDNFDGYMADIHLIDGQALTPTDFGEFNSDTGVWQPIEYTGTYGTNGFYLNFSDNSGTTSTTLGADSSGNGNNWTPNNFSVTAGAGNDSLVDSPTRYGEDTGAGGEVRGNYCTLNPLSKLNWLSQGGVVTPSNGNLEFAANSQGNMIDATIAVSSGKWYWEITQSNYIMNGVRSTRGIPTGDLTYRYYQNNGQIIYVPYNTTSTTVLTTVATATSGDIIGIALDLDNSTIAWYKNGSLLYTATSIVADEYAPCVGGASDSSGAYINFGQRPFAYTAPSGFKALVTTNLPEPTIADGREYFNTVLYAGTGSEQTLNVGFQPDFSWFKVRDLGTQEHALFDVLRGNNRLTSDTTNPDEARPNDFTGFTSNGVTIKGNQTFINNSSNNYVAWNWKANGAGVSNTAGTITSTVSANTDSGFSIVTYTGTGSAATVGHGLGVAPEMIIMKNRDRGIYWSVYTKTTGINAFLRLNTTDASTSSSGLWGSSAPTSTVFGISGTDFSNGAVAGEKIVAYCFAAVPGYSAFGSYTGNGSADGPFVYTGFRPAFVMVKCSSSNQGGNAWWVMYDNRRIGFNSDNRHFGAQVSDAEYTANSLDLLSSGFKLRDTNSSRNANGATYIFMAFAESPFAYSLAR